MWSTFFDNTTSFSNDYILKHNERKHITTKEYKGYVYFHAHDTLKHKSVTLTSDEIKRLYKKTPKQMKVPKGLSKNDTG